MEERGVWISALAEGAEGRVQLSLATVRSQPPWLLAMGDDFLDLGDEPLSPVSVCVCVCLLHFFDH